MFATKSTKNAHRLNCISSEINHFENPRTFCNCNIIVSLQKSTNRKIGFATFEISSTAQVISLGLRMAMTPRLILQNAGTRDDISHPPSSCSKRKYIENQECFYFLKSLHVLAKRNFLKYHAACSIISNPHYFFRRGSFLPLFKITFTDLTKLHSIVHTAQFSST